MLRKSVKKYKVLLIVLLIVAAYFVVAGVFPKSTGRFPIFVIIFLFDLYLWSAIKKWILNQSSVFKYSLGILYWLPLIAFSFTAVFGIFKPVQSWNISLYMNITGFVVISYIAKIFVAMFILLTDIVRGVQFISRHVSAKRHKKELHSNLPKISRNSFIKKLGFISGGLVLSTMLVGRFKWAFDFRLRTEDIVLPDLPDAFNGLKIVHFSDLHLGSWPSIRPIEEIVEIINAQNADLVLFTGDLVNFSTTEAFRFEDVLNKVKSKNGIYAILGNHDYGDYVNWESNEAKEENMRQLYAFYERIGWKLFKNEHDILNREGEELAILGVENWGAAPRFPKKANLNQALKGVGEHTTKLLMSHDPSHWEKVVSKKFKHIDLTLAGHTHGFQFGIETNLFRWSPAQYLYKYWAGLYRVKSQYIYVNRGTGYLGYPGRVGISPEITLINLSNR